VFVRREANRELIAAQVDKFDALRVAYDNRQA
jgi:putative heme iron utilization protein